MRYCKSAIFQANHNLRLGTDAVEYVVCDTAKVRFFKQITTRKARRMGLTELFAILQKYDFSSKSQRVGLSSKRTGVVCDTAKVRFFKQITTRTHDNLVKVCCLRYCKSTIFQANHNCLQIGNLLVYVVCDTAKVRFFKQITTIILFFRQERVLFAILQKYDFSSKSQPLVRNVIG